MELRVLRYYLTVVREGNISNAAAILHITQPTLSRQLMELELELGTSLFVRGKRQITLTDEGILFQQRAREIIELADRTEREFLGQKGVFGGTISIGCVESLSATDLLDLVEAFSQKYPNVRYDLYNGNADDIKEKLDKGLLDIALVLEPVEISKYNYIRLLSEERWGILMHTNDPMAEKETLTVEDLIGLPLIIPRRTIVQNEIASWFGDAYENMQILATFNLLSNTIQLVERSVGYAVCLQGTLTMRSKDTTCFVPLAPERTARSVLIWKKKHIFNAASSQFIESAKAYFRVGK